jgi:hypothetical protein
VWTAAFVQGLILIDANQSAKHPKSRRSGSLLTPLCKAAENYRRRPVAITAGHPIAVLSILPMIDFRELQLRPITAEVLAKNV